MCITDRDHKVMARVAQELGRECRSNRSVEDTVGHVVEDAAVSIAENLDLDFRHIPSTALTLRLAPGTQANRSCRGRQLQIGPYMDLIS